MSEEAGATPLPVSPSAWSPLQNGLFLSLWIATIVSNVADREIQQRAKRYLVEGASTKSQHWLADREG
jgi:hypothetical protein